MDEEPDILSFEPRRRGPRPGRGGWVAIFALGVLLGGLGAGTYLAVLVGHRDGTIGNLQAALRKASQPAPVAAEPVLPVDSGSALSTFPDGGDGSFSMVTAAVRPRPGAAALTWLFIYGQHADPGERYGLLEGTCGGQFVTSSDLADGTADSAGDLTIVAPNLDISPAAGDVWVLVYRLQDGVTLGGIQGPLIGGGAKTFRSVPRCLGATYPGIYGFIGVYGPPGNLSVFLACALGKSAAGSAPAPVIPVRPSGLPSWFSRYIVLVLGLATEARWQREVTCGSGMPIVRQSPLSCVSTTRKAG